MRRIRTRELGLGAAAMLVCLLAPATGLAEPTETTHDEYVARVEPICKTNVLANKRIFKGAKGEVKAGRLKPASKHFFRAAAAFAKTIGQIEKVPQPSADEVRLAKWLGYLVTEKEIVKQIGTALAAGDKHKASSYSVDLNANSNRANNTVLGFGFDYCRIDPARFG